MNGINLIIGTCIFIAIMIIATLLFLVQKQRVKRLKAEIAELDREKNKIVSAPIMSELSKVESILKNERLEEKYREWQKRFYRIKDERVPEINEMIIELDLFSNTRDKKALELHLAKCEIEVCKAREAIDVLLDEIREVTLSEEKYRNIVTKLKTKYRTHLQQFNLHKLDYEDMEQIIELQLENIEKRFQDFEEAMENNEYEEVVHIVKALDAMIDHMGIIVKEIPDLVLLSKKMLPKKMEEIEANYKEMKEKGYSLEYLKIEYNMKEGRKHLKNIFDRIKVLNLEDCMFELKTMVDYMDDIFKDFEREKLCRKLYEESREDFKKRIDKMSEVIGSIYNQLDDIMELYHLGNKDIKDIDKIKLRFEKLSSDFEELLKEDDKEERCYSKLMKTLDNLSIEFKQLENDFDNTLKNLGSMYEDEKRAREQLEDIEDMLKQCKIRIRSYKLPVITNNYFVELSEANDAILEIIKELDKKPIVIKVLNTRVDTARDLVLKLYNTTTDMIKKAQLAEDAILYGNRYRATSEEARIALENAESLFQVGRYQESLNASIGTISKFDDNIHKKLAKIN